MATRNPGVAGLVPPTPEPVPYWGNGFSRWLGRMALRAMGWRVTGSLPELRRFVAIASPHTSNWDWAVAMAVMFAMGIRFNYLVKDTVFIGPLVPLVPLLRWSGAIATNRLAPAGMVEDLVQRIRHKPEIILCITPEGTRARVEHWKTGFLRIAEAAQMPILLISWNYPDRVLTLGPLAELSGDNEVDVQRIRAYYRQFTGRNPGNQSP